MGCVDHPRTNHAYRDPEYRRNRRTVINQWVRLMGWVCPGIQGQPAHGVKKGELSADHIVPLSRGGGHDVTNLRVLCVRCNSMRGNGADE